MKFKKIFYLLLLIMLVGTIVSCVNSTSDKCKNGHTYDEGTIISDPTCESEGIIRYTCSVCNNTKDETLSALGHESGDTWYDDGDTHYHLCKNCGVKKLDVASHTYDSETHLCICGKQDPNYVEGYTVSFVYENCTITIFETQDVTQNGKTYSQNETFYARTSDGDISQTGDEQVNFVVTLSEGYEVSSIEVVSGGYKNIKNIGDGVYRITKITSDIVIKVITKEGTTKVELPTSLNNYFVYTGSLITFLPDNYDENLMIISNNEQTECGSYQAVVSLKDKATSVWEDGTTEDIKLDYYITKDKVTVNIPEALSTTYIYNGETITYIPEGFNDKIMTIANNEQVNAGEYKVIVSLIDEVNYVFTNGETTVQYDFIINKKSLEKPTLSITTYYYNAELVTIDVENFVETLMTISNNQQQEIGTYEAIIELTDKSNYMWSDASTSNITLEWEIVESLDAYVINKVSDTQIVITHTEDEKSYELTVIIPTNTTYEVNQETGTLTLTYQEVSSTALSFTLSGSYYGALTFNINEETDLEINLNNVAITSKVDCPLYVASAGNVDISAKKNTENSITDERDEAEELASCIYTTCDLKLKGAGTLNVYSKNNNGIHSKDDLEVQKLTLNVNSVDNALKGNDEVVISSGTLTLIARQGDGIKSSNTALSSKGNQKGSIIIEDGVINIYAATDGIDAAYDLTINGGTINIYTDKYSEYSEEVTVVSEDIYYIRSNTTAYKYSIYYYNTTDDGEWVNSDGTYITMNAGRENYYYYKLNKLSGYSYLKVYVYTSAQEQGQSSSYYKSSSQTAINDNYDTIAFTTNSRYGSTSQFSWTNYTTSQGGMGQMDQGNTDKGDYSTKGLKADNEITINGGTIFIKAYDDAIHTNNDVEMESGVTATGNITINGGILTLYSNDDAVHADGTLLISGGTINITNSYEGLEGSVVEITGGNISIISSDDGINGVATTGTSISIKGGDIYICAGGDGVDSNSQTSYSGIVFSGGTSVIISYGRADSSIDTERGYKYEGGYVVAIGISGGMSNESTMCSNFSSIGTSKTISLTMNNYLVVSSFATIKMPKSMSAFVVVLGATSASISTSTTTTDELNSNGICWKK